MRIIVELDYNKNGKQYCPHCCKFLLTHSSGRAVTCIISGEILATDYPKAIEAVHFLRTEKCLNSELNDASIEDSLKYVETVCRNEQPTMKILGRDGHLNGILSMVTSLRKEITKE